MDVEAQKRGKVDLPGNSDDDAPQIAPGAHLAIGAFSQLDPEERKDLGEAAEEGDEEAKEELCTEGTAAIEAMIEALEDKDARRLIGLGMMLANSYIYNAEDGTRTIEHETGEIQNTGRLQNAVSFLDPLEGVGVDVADHDPNKVKIDEKLDMIQTRLEAELEHFMRDQSEKNYR